MKTQLPRVNLLIILYQYNDREIPKKMISLGICGLNYD